MLQLIFQKILQNQTFQKTEKFFMVDFYEMDFWLDVQFLEKSASHWLLVERWWWNWMTKNFAGVYFWMLMCLRLT